MRPQDIQALNQRVRDTADGDGVAWPWLEFAASSMPGKIAIVDREDEYAVVDEYVDPELASYSPTVLLHLVDRVRSRHLRLGERFGRSGVQWEIRKVLGIGEQEVERHGDR